MKSEKTTAGINPAELRIGNYLNYGNYLVRVVEIKKTVFMVEYPNYENANTMQSEHDNFEPIHLAEEWLIRFGFVQELYDDTVLTGEWNKYFLKVMSISGNTGKWQISIGGRNLPTTIKSLHELQNLYFALTGEEITL
jgi:hypothetical protein